MTGNGRKENKMFKANLLKAEMVKQNVNAEELAERIGMKKSAFFRRLNGSVDFSVEEVRKVKNALKLSGDQTLQIFFGE
jgi:hypothetical protein